MTDEAAAFLISADGAEVLSVLADHPQDSLEAGRFLRRRFPNLPTVFLAAAMELTVARKHAAGKFDRADELFYTREALEQATDTRIAEHRAKRFAGLGQVYDLCCGIGGDAIALGRIVSDLVCVDNDPARVLFCRENMRILGVSGEVREADVSEMYNAVSSTDAVFIDPARRIMGKRTGRPDIMIPPIDTVTKILDASPRGAAKLSPAIDPSIVMIPHEIEWISTETGLKEAVVWTGGFKDAHTSVTLMHYGVTLTDRDLPESESGVRMPGAYLYEPDPALIRSGLLGRIASSLGMWRLSEHIAYMTADTLIGNQFFTGYRVIDSFPFSLKRLRDCLSVMNAGPVTIKKRGFPLLPEDIVKKLNLSGELPATVVLTRLGSGHHAFIVERL